jgi:hypothetical protein
MGQSLEQLGQALQAGDLSSAQQAYSSLQQEFSQFSNLLAGAQTVGQSGTSNISMSA